MIRGVSFKGTYKWYPRIWKLRNKTFLMVKAYDFFINSLLAFVCL